MSPLSTLETIEQRRSVKHYEADFEMPEEDAKRLLELALLSPTSFNIQNWRIVWVRNPELREKIQGAAWGQTQVTEASMLLIMCADLNAWNHSPERYWKNAPQPVQEFLVPKIKEFYQGQEGLQRDEAMRSCGIAAQTLMLAAKGMGYDSCPMIGFDPQQVGELIELPEEHVISMILVIGKAAQDPWPRGGQISMDEVVITDRFKASTTA